jgi:hypothetical protein
MAAAFDAQVICPFKDWRMAKISIILLSSDLF